jgi:hypothetical protein
MMYQYIADLIIVLHFGFILFVVAGGFFLRKRWWLTALHLMAMGWAVYVELSPGLICPLTDLENYFARRGGLDNYEEDFVMRYLVPVIYQDGLTPNIQYGLAAIVIVINVFAYSRLWKRN